MVGLPERLLPRILGTKCVVREASMHMYAVCMHMHVICLHIHTCYVYAQTFCTYALARYTYAIHIRAIYVGRIPK